MFENIQLVSNVGRIEVSFMEALSRYKRGEVIECRIVNDHGIIIDWEKYHMSEGLEIALEFDEIINGKWYIESK